MSTLGQTTQKQVREIAGAGFRVATHRIVTGTVSGSEAIARRREFGRLLDRLGAGDVVVVTCLALGGVGLTPSSGRMTRGVIGAVAQFERDLLVERTQAGIAPARAEGGTPGSPFALRLEQHLAAGESVAAVAKAFDTSRRTIPNARDAAGKPAGTRRSREPTIAGPFHDRVGEGIPEGRSP